MECKVSLWLEFGVDGPMGPDLAERFISCAESFLPDTQFLFENHPPGQAKFRKIPDRKGWLEVACRSGVWTLAPANANKHPGLFVRFVDRGGERYFAALYCFLPFPKLDDFIMACGDLLRSYSMQYSTWAPPPLLGILRDPAPENTRIFVPNGKTRIDHGVEVPEGAYRLARDIALEELPHLARLPRTRSKPPQTLDGWKCADRIEWLNYWSDEVAERAGLDASLGDRLPFFKFMKTEHGWYFRLTEAPLDIRIREHADLLLAVYDALPRVGTIVN